MNGAPAADPRQPEFVASLGVGSEIRTGPGELDTCPCGPLGPSLALGHSDSRGAMRSGAASQSKQDAVRAHGVLPWRLIFLLAASSGKVAQLLLRFIRERRFREAFDDHAQFLLSVNIASLLKIGFRQNKSE